MILEGIGAANIAEDGSPVRVVALIHNARGLHLVLPLS
jgi:hypothetical protein